MSDIINDLIKGLNNPQDVPPYLFQQLNRKIKTHVIGFPARYYYNRNQTHIFERDWDVLLILDACRVDTIESYSDKYDFIPSSAPHITSVNGGSPGWLANTFNKKWKSEMEKTTYISANPHTKRVLGSSTDGMFASRGGNENNLEDFDTFVPLWQSHWDEDLGTVPARPITNSLIKFCRNNRSKRVIAHYMQPHFPSVPTQLGSGLDIDNEADWESGHTWELVYKGDITMEEAYTAYGENLLYVLDEVKLALENIDADVVISADHGNAFGEWGEIGHGQRYRYLGVVSNVPWIRTTASDNRTHTPKIEKEPVNQDSDDINEKLRALGYKS